MFNSPLQYCKVCKQYIALDQSQEECAKQHGCRVEVCPYAGLFSPPAESEETKAHGASEAPSGHRT